MQPKRDVSVEWIGSVISLHSIYLVCAVSGSIIAIGGALPVMRWAWNTPSRLKEEKSARVVNDMEQLQKFLKEIEELPPFQLYEKLEVEETVELSVRRMEKIGFNFPDRNTWRRGVLFTPLLEWLSWLLPHVRTRGIKEVLADKDLNENFKLLYGAGFKKNED